MATNGPKPMSWDEYESYVSTEWQQCLNSATLECEVQRFMEKHPCLVPGGPGWHNTDGVGHHQPFHHAVITQPPLQGTFRRSPDFMWVTWDSASIRPVLVEIENPTKKWFTGQGLENADLKQAREQLTQWQTWLEDNEEGFRKSYELDGSPYLSLIHI